MEADIQQYYAASNPGAVAVLGPDCWNGSSSQLTSFKNQTGATFPLLLSAGDVSTLYGIAYDNFLVIDTQGIVRYISPTGQPLANRYDLTAIRATIDDLLQTDVETRPEDVPAAAPHIRVAGSLAPGAPLRLRVEGVTRGTLELVSMTGAALRQFAVEAAGAPVSVAWDGRDARGRRVAPGVYAVRLRAPGGAVVETRRVVVVR